MQTTQASLCAAVNLLGRPTEEGFMAPSRVHIVHHQRQYWEIQPEVQTKLLIRVLLQRARETYIFILECFLQTFTIMQLQLSLPQSMKVLGDYPITSFLIHSQSFSSPIPSFKTLISRQYVKFHKQAFLRTWLALTKVANFPLNKHSRSQETARMTAPVRTLTHSMILAWRLPYWLGQKSCVDKYTYQFLAYQLFLQSTCSNNW